MLPRTKELLYIDSASRKELLVRQEIEIPTIVLDWSDWCSWGELKLDARTGFGAVSIPTSPGVYEARQTAPGTQTEERLTIGKATDLRNRVKQGLVKGKIPHSAGKKIRAGEPVSGILVRWAVTNRPAATEEELHRLYKDKVGGLPKYTERT